MRNLEQIRAANALNASSTVGKGREGGSNVAKKFPTYIRNNGLLGAAAFARESKEGYEHVVTAVIEHLRHDEVGLIQASGLDDFIVELGEADSTQLRLATNEAMAYLNYLRRFAD